MNLFFSSHDGQLRTLAFASGDSSLPAHIVEELINLGVDANLAYRNGSRALDLAVQEIVWKSAKNPKLRWDIRLTLTMLKMQLSSWKRKSQKRVQKKKPRSLA